MDSYLTVAQADSHYQNILPVAIWGYDSEGLDILIDLWEDSTTPIKERALTQATSIIDSFLYDGVKNDPNQSHQFPRNSQPSVPQEVQQATMALTLSLLKQHLVHENIQPWIAKGMYVNASRIESLVAEARESLSLREQEKGYYTIIHPYLKRWLKGRYRSVDHA